MSVQRIFPLLVMLAPILLFVVGCSDNSDPSSTGPESQATTEQRDTPPNEVPHIEGTITKMTDTSIHISDDPEDPEASQRAEIQVRENTRFLIQQEQELNEGDQGDLKQGMQVKVWYEGIVKDTYPIQATGGFIVYEK